MFPNQAQVVLNNVMASVKGKPMEGRWDDNVSDYPEIIKATLVVVVNTFALEWIDKELPMAWFRPMFDPKQLAQI